MTPATYPLDIARRRMQTETFIINNLVAKGWSSTDPLSGPIEKPKQGVGLVEHSGDNFLRIWQRVIQREGVRGLFKVSNGVCVKYLTCCRHRTPAVYCERACYCG